MFSCREERTARGFLKKKKRSSDRKGAFIYPDETQELLKKLRNPPLKERDGNDVG